MIPLAIYAQSPWDKYTLNDPKWQQWMRERPEMVIGWDPWQKPNIGVIPNLLIYVDAYAIYNPSDVATEHPEWILHDDAGNKLYIPFNCAGGKCSQWAGDLSNPHFAQAQMARIQALSDAGYQGVYLDDVNLQMTVSDGDGKLVAPSGVTPEDWAKHFVAFLEEVRSSFPKLTICHNSVWFANALEVWVNRQIVASNYCTFERGYGDPNLSLEQMMKQLRAVDRVHRFGRNILQLEYTHDNLQFKIDAFRLGYKPGDLMILADLFPDDTSGAWALVNSNGVE